MSEYYLKDRTTGLSKKDVVDNSDVDIAREMIKRKAYHDKLLRENAVVTYNGKNFSENTGIYSVMFCDANFLKLINEFYGYEEGTKELKNIASIIATCLRTQKKEIDGPDHRIEETKEEDEIYYGSHLKDIVAARYGGDEFLIILPNCTKESAEPVKSRINHAIEKGLELKRYEADEKGIDPNEILSLTLSFGIADTNDLPIPEKINETSLKNYFQDIVKIASDRMKKEKLEMAANMEEEELLPFNASYLGRLYDVNGTEDIETIIERLRKADAYRNERLKKII